MDVAWVNKVHVRCLESNMLQQGGSRTIVQGDISSSLHSEIGYKAPVTTSPNTDLLNRRAADLRLKIMTKLETWNLSEAKRISARECESPTIPTKSITETKRLICTSAMLGYKMNNRQ